MPNSASPGQAGWHLSLQILEVSMYGILVFKA